MNWFCPTVRSEVRQRPQLHHRQRQHSNTPATCRHHHHHHHHHHHRRLASRLKYSKEERERERRKDRKKSNFSFTAETHLRSLQAGISQKSSAPGSLLQEPSAAYNGDKWHLVRGRVLTFWGGGVREGKEKRRGQVGGKNFWRSFC